MMRPAFRKTLPESHQFIIELLQFRRTHQNRNGIEGICLFIRIMRQLGNIGFLNLGNGKETIERGKWTFQVFSVRF